MDSTTVWKYKSLGNRWLPLVNASKAAAVSTVAQRPIWWCPLANANTCKAAAACGTQLHPNCAGDRQTDRQLSKTNQQQHSL